MKKIVIKTPLIIFVIVFIVSFCLVSCEKKEDTINDKERAKLSEQFFKTVSKPNQEAVALLSQKYDLNAETIEGFLDQYLSETDMGYRLIKDAAKSSNTNVLDSDFEEMIGLEYDKYLTILKKEAQTYRISAKTAAQIIIDYKTLTFIRDYSE